MPIDVSYTDEGSGAVLVCEGVVTGHELIATLKDVFSRDLVAQPYLYKLFDCNGMKGIDVTFQDIKDAAQLGVAASRDMPNFVAAIYANSDAAFGLARMWEAYVQQTGWKTHVFRSRHEAVAWLKTAAEKISGRQITLS